MTSEPGGVNRQESLWRLSTMIGYADGVFGKIGEGGVAVDTVEDMERLYDGFDLACREGFLDYFARLRRPDTRVSELAVAAPVPRSTP